MPHISGREPPNNVGNRNANHNEMGTVFWFGNQLVGYRAGVTELVTKLIKTSSMQKRGERCPAGRDGVLHSTVFGSLARAGAPLLALALAAFRFAGLDLLGIL